MKNQGYCLIENGKISDGNIEDTTYPLRVNCAGAAYIDFPFENGFYRRDFYLQYLLEGEMEIFKDGYTLTASAGDFVIHSPHAKYSYRRRGDAPLNYLWMHFTGYDAASLLRRIGIETDKTHHAGVRGDIEVLFECLYAEFLDRHKSLPDSSAACATRILCALSRLADSVHAGQHQSRSFVSSLSYIHLHYDTDISVPALAEMENLSESRYRALFRKKLNMSATDYIIRLRMERAAELCRTTELPLKEISSMCGYEDNLYFSRLFKSRMGLSPKEYRAANRLGKKTQSSD